MMRPTLRALLMVACFAGAAQAQLGSLIKKAAGKVVEQKTEEKVNELQPAKPLEGDPVGASTLDGVLKGLAFEVERQAEAAKIGDARRAKAEEFHAANDASRADEEAYSKANSKVMSCVSRSLNKSADKHQDEIAERMMNLANDPKGQELIKQITDVSTRLTEAVQKKDTAQYKRLNQQMMRALGADPAKDSAVAYKECGTPPAMPASYVKTLKLQKEHEDLSEDLRKVELNLFERAAATAGMKQKEYFLARERIWAWNDARKAKSGSGGVTRDEDALFKSRLADIRKVEKALR